MSQQLTDLLARLEAAEGADRELDYRIFTATAPMEQFSPWDPKDRLNHFTASLDASLALVERVLPGWVRGVDENWDEANALYWTANLCRMTGPAFAVEAYAKTSALALLCAFVRALIAKEGQT